MDNYLGQTCGTCIDFEIDRCKSESVLEIILSDLNNKSTFKSGTRQVKDFNSEICINIYTDEDTQACSHWEQADDKE